MKMDVKPHLKEINELYRKVCEFESSVELKHEYSLMKEPRRYVKEDIETVINAFSASVNTVQEDLSFINDAMQSGEIDFISLVSDEKIPEEDFSLLYIISRPFFKSMKNSGNADNMNWDEGRCPVCNAIPSLSVIDKESRRRYFCSWCGSVGYYKRIGCPNCLTDNPQDITVISLEGEEGMRADACGKCKSYCKSFEGSMMLDNSIDELDIMSLPLDIIVQGEGYMRHSPNPVGMIRMEQGREK
jgi:formate dehydrogenase maturation protein FdhE